MSTIHNRCATGFQRNMIDLGRDHAVLMQHFSDTCDLVRAVDRSRMDICREGVPNIESLLEGLWHELHAYASVVLERIENLAPELDVFQTARKPHSPGSMPLPDCERDFCPRLKSLLDLYMSYERECERSVAILERLGDLESSRLVNRSSAIAAKGRWFLSAYLAVLTAKEDVDHLPEWPHIVMEMLRAGEPGRSM